MILEYHKPKLTSKAQTLVTKIAQLYQLPPFIATLICERNHFNEQGITEYIEGCSKPKPFDTLKDIHKALSLIQHAISHQHLIRIVGDYDVDGVTSTYVLLTAFEMLGYPYISHYLPLREKDGYGLNTDIVDTAFKEGIQMIITVDNGIAAVDAVRHAKSLGMTVIITDHHEIPKVIPEADAIINPHQADCPYPYKTLAGVGLAYKLSQALITTFKIKPPLPLIQRIQALVALGTVCDVAPLIGENRFLVQAGLKALNNHALPAASIIAKRCSVGTLGFQIGPRLNACGRLESAEIALQFLKCQDPKRLIAFKDQLDRLNATRQKEEQDCIKRILDKLACYESIPDIIVEVDEQAHESIVGLVAGKVKEMYYRPTIIFSKTIQGTYKGSGRSIEEYDMFQHIKPFMHYFYTGGGHPMACGLGSKTLENIELFKKDLNAASTLTDYDKTPKLYVDHIIHKPEDYDFNLLEKQLKLFLPTGAGNTAPVLLVKQVPIHIKTKYAKTYRISEVSATCATTLIKGTLWNDPSIPEEGSFCVDLTLSVNEFGWQIGTLFF